MLYANQVGRPFSDGRQGGGSNRYRGTTRNVIDEQRQADSLANFGEVISQACLRWFAVIGCDHENSVRAGLLRCRRKLDSFGQRLGSAGNDYRDALRNCVHRYLDQLNSFLSRQATRFAGSAGHNYTVRTLASLAVHQLSKLFVVNFAVAKRCYDGSIRAAENLVFQRDHFPVTTSANPLRLVANPLLRPNSLGSLRKSSCQSRDPSARCMG